MRQKLIPGNERETEGWKNDLETKDWKRSLRKTGKMKDWKNELEI